MSREASIWQILSFCSVLQLRYTLKGCPTLPISAAIIGHSKLDINMRKEEQHSVRKYKDVLHRTKKSVRYIVQAQRDHKAICIHLVISVPHKYAVSTTVMGYLKGELTLKLFERY